MNKIAIWIANIFSEKAVHDIKDACRVIISIGIALLLTALLHELVKHDPMPMEDIPSNALAQ